MGTVQRFGERPPTKRQFRLMIEERLSRVGERRPLVFHPRRYAISWQGSEVVDLEGYYNQYAAACQTGATTTKQNVFDEIIKLCQQI